MNPNIELLSEALPCTRCDAPTKRTYDGVPICVLCRSAQVREALVDYNLARWREQGVVWEPGEKVRT